MENHLHIRHQWISLSQLSFLHSLLDYVSPWHVCHVCMCTQQTACSECPRVHIKTRGDTRKSCVDTVFEIENHKRVKQERKPEVLPHVDCCYVDMAWQKWCRKFWKCCKKLHLTALHSFTTYILVLIWVIGCWSLSQQSLGRNTP